MRWFKVDYEIWVVDIVLNKEFVGMYNVYIVLKNSVNVIDVKVLFN